MSKIVAEKKWSPVEQLFDAVVAGNVAVFRQLLRQHPNIVDEFRFSHANTTPLLHIAAAKGDSTIASMPMEATPKMCWKLDRDGKNPIHVAAENGHDDILLELIQRAPLAAREKVNRGPTAMHLCVKHGHLSALRILVESSGELVYEEDENGDTILHLAVRCKNYEIVKYLVENNILERGLRNSKGITALDIVEKLQPDDQITSDIKGILWTWSFLPESLNRVREITIGIAFLIAVVAYLATGNVPFICVVVAVAMVIVRLL